MLSRIVFSVARKKKQKKKHARDLRTLRYPYDVLLLEFLKNIPAYIHYAILAIRPSTWKVLCEP